jgi:hypothetical protein
MAEGSFHGAACSYTVVFPELRELAFFVFMGRMDVYAMKRESRTRGEV